MWSSVSHVLTAGVGPPVGSSDRSTRNRGDLHPNMSKKGSGVHLPVSAEGASFVELLLRKRQGFRFEYPERPAHDPRNTFE